MNTILFDMDGTLLPMDIDEFTMGYFKFLCKKMAPLGYDGDELIKAIWEGTKSMVLNNGEKTNEKVFWDRFREFYGNRAETDYPVFEDFYENDFGKARVFCGFNPEVAVTMKRILDAGYKVAIATNPIFPQNAMRQRLEWAGLNPDDFELITSYENSHYCKPNPEYFREVLEKLGAAPEDCLMVGNDATEDLAAQKAGIRVFLLTDGLLNRDNVDISSVPQGGYPELNKFIFG